MDDVTAHEVEMLEHQKLIGQCLRAVLLLGWTGPARDDLAERWATLETFRGAG